MRRKHLSLGFAVLAHALGACGTTEVELTSAMKETAAALCERQDECECAQATANCEDEELARWTERVKYAEQHRLDQDDACVERVRDTLRADECAVGSRERHECTQYCSVFSGSRKRGEACDARDALTSNCEQGLVCAEGECVEACAVLSGIPAGERCGDTSDTCALGASCDYERERCVPGRAEGEDCASGCGLGLYCDSNSYVCARPGGAGAHCYDQLGCAQPYACSYASNECVAKGGDGARCEYDDSACEDGFFCDGSSCREPPGPSEPCATTGRCAEGLACSYDGGFPVCVTRASAGERCDAVNCASGLFCDRTSMDPTEWTCHELWADGEPCNDSTTCQSLSCPHGSCAPRPAEGEDCVNGTCARGLVCEGERCVPARGVGPLACVYGGWVG